MLKGWIALILAVSIRALGLVAPDVAAPCENGASLALPDGIITVAAPVAAANFMYSAK